MSERNETESGSEVLSEYHADGLDHFPVRDMAEEIARLREALRGLVAAHDRWRDAVRSVVGPGFGDGAFPELEAAREALGDG